MELKILLHTLIRRLKRLQLEYELDAPEAVIDLEFKLINEGFEKLKKFY